MAEVADDFEMCRNCGERTEDCECKEYERDWK